MKVSITFTSANRDRYGFAIPKVELPELGQHWELDIGLADLYRRFGIPNPRALDFVLFASACYTADKVVSRKTAPDNWTRDLVLSMAVSDPDAWNAIAGELSQTLGFLTGDFWALSFQPLSVALFRRTPRTRLRQVRARRDRRNEVCLFSGGLDSLAGALDLLATSQDTHLFLMGHYDIGGPKETQSTLFTGIEEAYGERVELVQVRAAYRPMRAEEPTMRSRSLVFLALGMYAASSLGPDVPLYAHENGFVALNLPLTPSRVGSCSTRTMHPYFLEQLTDVLDRLGLQNPVINPYRLKVKGECITECADIASLRALAAQSQSCAHPGRRQNWIRKSANNCGYCYPCLIRRAAMHTANLDQGRHYGIDVCADELLPDDDWDSAADLRALIDFVNRGWSAGTLRQEILKVALISDLPEYAAMAEHGVQEIRRQFLEKGSARLRAAFTGQTSSHD